MSNDSDLLAILLDFSFSEFVTTRLLKWLYIAALAGSTIVALIFGLGAFERGFGSGLLGLIIAAVGLIFAAILTRIYVELVIVVFRIAENTARTADSLSGGPRSAEARTPTSAAGGSSA